MHNVYAQSHYSLLESIDKGDARLGDTRICDGQSAIYDAVFTKIYTIFARSDAAATIYFIA